MDLLQNDHRSLGKRVYPFTVVVLVLCCCFFHDCKKGEYFNFCSVWCPAVLENVFGIAEAKTLPCRVDIPREQGWRAVETWVNLEVASSLCWTSHWAVRHRSDLCGPLRPPYVGCAALNEACVAVPRHAAWLGSFCTVSCIWCCRLILSLVWFVLLLLLLLYPWGKECNEMFSLSRRWNPLCA